MAHWGSGMELAFSVESLFPGSKPANSEAPCRPAKDCLTGGQVNGPVRNPLPTYPRNQITAGLHSLRHNPITPGINY